MCEQCVTNSVSITTPLDKEGWVLIQATKDGHFMKKGQYGLVRMNDPDFVWTEKPYKEPNENDPALDAWFEAVDRFTNEFASGPLESYEIVKACIRLGYKKKIHGSFSHWLFDFLGQSIK